MSVTHLDTLATGLLDALVDGLALVTTGIDPPTRQYVSHGAPAWDGCGDCESGGQATVWLERIEHRGQRDSRQTCDFDPWATFVLEWAVCVPGLPDSGWPDEDDLDLSAGNLLTQLWAVLTEVYDRAASGSLGASCQGIDVGDAVALEPQGQCAGWSVRVTLAVQDTGPVGS